MNILLSAYSCEPHKGSESGVGWNLALELSKFHNITVVARRKKRPIIEEYLKENPVKNLSFYYHDLPNWLMSFKDMMGTQAYYVLWNLTLIPKMRKFVKEQKIDIIHHVTFNQYRTPSFGYFIDTPFVIGPVGGAEYIDHAFDDILEPQTLKRENYRREGKDKRILKWLMNHCHSSKTILFSAKENLINLKDSVSAPHIKTAVLPAIAIKPEDFAITPLEKKSNTFDMVYAGRALDWKGLQVFMEAFGKVHSQMPAAKAILIGINSEKENALVNRWIEENGLNGKVEIIKFIPRKDLLQMLTTANLFVYPAFRDSGSMAVLEACALGCPSICFDAGGQDAFPDNTVIKVAIERNNYSKTLNNFSDKLMWAYNHRQESKQIGKKAQEYVYEHLTWQKKAETFDAIYQSLIL